MHLTQNWQIRKPGASSRGGIVASQNGIAAQVGAEVLQAGGSAVDAVVATAFALAAVEPWNSGLGGIGFMVVHQAGADRAEIVDFGPVAPRGLDPAAFPLTGEMRTELFTWPQVVGRPQHARAAVLCDPERGARLCSGGRALRAVAVARSLQTGRRARPRRACRSTGSRR